MGYHVWPEFFCQDFAGAGTDRLRSLPGKRKQYRYSRAPYCWLIAAQIPAGEKVEKRLIDLEILDVSRTGIGWRIASFRGLTLTHGFSRSHSMLA